MYNVAIIAHIDTVTKYFSHFSFFFTFSNDDIITINRGRFEGDNIYVQIFKQSK